MVFSPALPAHTFSISTRCRLHTRARHQNAVAVASAMKHDPGTMTSCRSRNRSTRRMPIATTTSTRASTSNTTVRNTSAKDAAPKVFFARYGKATSMRLTWRRLWRLAPARARSEQCRGTLRADADHADRRADGLLDLDEIRARLRG